ncbi:family S53 protease [Auriculariales sp. MPI-PUGE-AT-0066]|nr:family S53 protease [Auriculariales sp. MPI-PUGE-AT-0066]
MLALSLLSLSICAIVTARTVEQLSHPPAGFAKVAPAPADYQVTLSVALQQGTISRLEQRVLQVSTPSHAAYGKHLTKVEVEGYLRPSAEAWTAATSWFMTNGINAVNKTSSGNWLSIKASVGQLEKLFDTELALFMEETTKTVAIRALAYSIPDELVQAIELVHPLTSFWVSPPRQSLQPSIISTATSRSPQHQARALASCPDASSIFVPVTCFMDLYGIPKTPATATGNKVAVTGYIREWAKHSDLQLFFQQYRPDLADPITFSEELVSGEAALDIEAVMGIATNVPTTALYFADLPDEQLPQVVSTSYGSDESRLSPALAERICNVYMQLAARGVSLLFCSGDGGVEGFYANQACTNFSPTFPSTCPYVTSVGGTRYWTQQEAGSVFSSGGFSNMFSRPAWQDAAVNSYLAALPLNHTSRGRFNESGRAFPDVSAQSLWLALIVNGQLSTPIFAAAVALLNDRLIAAGRSPLGWLNPWLYSDAVGAWNDVRAEIGSGWDPVTGLGTPNFPALLQVLGLA